MSIAPVRIKKKKDARHSRKFVFRLKSFPSWRPDFFSVADRFLLSLFVCRPLVDCFGNSTIFVVMTLVHITFPLARSAQWSEKVADVGRSSDYVCGYRAIGALDEAASIHFCWSLQLRTYRLYPPALLVGLRSLGLTSERCWPNIGVVPISCRFLSRVCIVRAEARGRKTFYCIVLTKAWYKLWEIHQSWRRSCDIRKAEKYFDLMYVWHVQGTFL